MDYAIIWILLTKKYATIIKIMSLHPTDNNKKKGLICKMMRLKSG